MEEAASDRSLIPLLFHIVDGPTDELRRKIKDTVEKVAASRAWSVGPPEFVNEIEETGASGDEPLVVVGGVLELHSSFPPHALPLALEWQELGDAEALIAAVWALSEQTGATFEFMYNDEVIGEIAKGVVDEGLAIVFLDEWRKVLQLKTAVGR